MDQPSSRPLDLTTPRGRRKAIIEIARRRQRSGTGSDLHALMKAPPMHRWPDLSATLDPLPWAVVGAVAARLYMPERATADMDILVPAAHLAEAERRLREASWQWQGSIAIGGSAWLSPQGVRLDVLVCNEQWCEKALKQAGRNRDAQGLPILPLPYLILLKLRSGRLQDSADIARMLGLADDATLDRVREVVRAWACEDLEDLEALIELGRLEARGPASEGPAESGVGGEK